MAEVLKSNKELEGQVAVVTGAARGIGAAIAEKLAAMGALVILTARDQAALDRVRAKIERAGGSATVAVCDLTDEAAIQKLGETVHTQTGRCDVLVNCAGVATAGTPLHELAPHDWDAMMDVNLKAPYLLIRTFAPLMIAGEVWPYREYFFACRQEFPAEWRGLLGFKVGAQRTHIFRRRRTAAVQHPRFGGCTRLGQHAFRRYRCER